VGFESFTQVPMFHSVPTLFNALARAALVLFAVFIGTLTGHSAEAESKNAPVVAAAASIQFALGEIIDSFYSKTGVRVRLSLGSSGNLSRQIRQGAPYQLFLSADERYVQELTRDGLTEGDGVIYSLGRIAIIVPHGSPLTADGALEDLRTALTDGRLKKFAIANPEHAPYGQRAEEALRFAGLWEGIRAHLVFGENVAQAAQFATSSNAEGGIIAYSLALSPQVSELGTSALIPADWYRPLRQRMALIKDAGPGARRFYEFLQQPPARAVFRKHGFEAPGEPD
jgi:molybdate transport system substrate-binding protein